jgi:hypothetical protein
MAAEAQAFDVEVTRSITTTVRVEAGSPEAAWSTVNRACYELPPRDQWTGSKDWEFVVYDQAGRELGRDDGGGYYDTIEPGDDEETGAAGDTDHSSQRPGTGTLTRQCGEEGTPENAQPG